MSIDSEVLISFRNITKKFNEQSVISNLDLNIYSSEIMCLLGKSGCGKSTLLKILLGFYKADFGVILYNNINLLDKSLEIRKIVGFVSQENSFYEKLTIEENLIFFAKLYGVKKEEYIERMEFLLKLVKLEGYRTKLAENISGGMKRRLEFAISLIHDPKILILDEPFNGLDIQISEEIWQVIEKIKNSGVTVLIVTHILESAKAHCDRAVFMDNGRIVYEVNNLKQSSIDLEAIFKEVLFK